MNRRPLLSLLGVLTVLVLIAVATLPAIAADPSPGPPGRAGKSPKPEKPPITITGPVTASTDADGNPVYTLRSGGTTYTLDAGPSWYHGDNNPLKAFVGRSVTVVGGKSADSNEVDVETVDGTALRAAGKPPWAGGWKRVGDRHPGWSQEKADRFQAKFGDCFPPGKCKEKPLKPNASEAP